MATWAGAVACILAAGGCGVSTAPLVVGIRDAQTHAAVTGAGVEADSLALGPSTGGWDVIDLLLGKREAYESRGVTDSKGEVVLKYVPGRAVRVVVLGVKAADGMMGGPGFVLIERELEMGMTEWMTVQEGGGIEVRAGPPK